jgi:hypothetical protein
MTWCCAWCGKDYKEKDEYKLGYCSIKCYERHLENNLKYIENDAFWGA